MTTIDNIMALADQYMGWGAASDRQALRAAIEQVLRDECEACAKVCESIGARRDQYADPVGAGAADECAAAIRSRGNT
jgi:LPS sulfotransferase NodH